MSSKRSFQQREEEPWLRYPDLQNTTRDYSRSSGTSLSSTAYKHQSSSSLEHSRLDRFDHHTLQSVPVSQQHPHRTAETIPPLSTLTTKQRHALSRISAPPSYHHQPLHDPALDHDLRFRRSNYRRSSWSRRAPQPRTLSEELSSALLQTAEDSYPSPTTSSGLLSSPADMSMLSSPASSTSTMSSSGHFPLFKSSSQSPPAPLGSGTHQKPRPTSLALNLSNTNGQGSTPELDSGSPTAAISQDTTAAMDVAGMAASLGSSPSLQPPSTLHANRNFMSSAASESGSSYYSISSSPRASDAACSALCPHHSSHHQHHASCLHSHHHNQHHPTCQHYTSEQEPELDPLEQGPKLGRATKGIQRFGFPRFRPVVDESLPRSSNGMTTTLTRTTSTSTSGSGYGIQRNRDDDEDSDDLDPTYAFEPPKKRQRSTASMLLDAAVETVIFTGAVALSAYQLLTGKTKPADLLLQSSSELEDADTIAQKDDDENVKTPEEDPMEEKLSLQSDTFSTDMFRTIHSDVSFNGFEGSSRTEYRKAKPPRSYRSRQSYASSRSHSGHSRAFSMPARPNTGTEDTDEAFLRMEAQLNSLIAEGKRALNRRIEIWDEE